ncbi:MAG: alpha-glucan family phosphorylase [bacterium]
MPLTEYPRNESISRSKEYLRRTGRQDLEKILSPQTPLIYASPEYGLDGLGPEDVLEKIGRLGYAGGLGILSGDHVRQMAQTGLPTEAIGILHTRWMKPQLSADNWQMDVPMPVLSPAELGLKKIEGVEIAISANNTAVRLDAYSLDVGGQTTLNLLYESGLGEVYPGQPKDDHRMYQMAVLGFGGWQLMQQTNKEPAKLHLNESSTALTAVAMWDMFMQRNLNTGMDPQDAFTESLKAVRERTILTNHTLVPAAEAEYTAAQYENFVLGNIQSGAIKTKLREIINWNSGKMRILDLGMYLSGQFNGVSKLHAELATDQFKSMYGPVLDGHRPMVFEAVTNAIDERWFPETYKLYREAGIMDEFDLPTADYKEKTERLDANALHQTKSEAKATLRRVLATTQLGNNENGPDGHPVPLYLPDDAIVIGWARRFADYKRPHMMLDDMARLKEILEKHPQAHIVYSGKTHPTDDPMKRQLQALLYHIQGDDVLRERVHFIQNYNIEIGKALTAGADVWVNTPRVGKEACGTSIFKAVANNALLVSTPDGGAADVSAEYYLPIEGYPDEVRERDSLYKRIDEAITLTKDKDAWATKAKKQLSAFLPIICGGRMIRDYLNFSFPQV